MLLTHAEVVPYIQFIYYRRVLSDSQGSAVVAIELEDGGTDAKEVSIEVEGSVDTRLCGRDHAVITHMRVSVPISVDCTGHATPRIFFGNY